MRMIDAIPLEITHDQYQWEIEKLLTEHGYWCYHTGNSRGSKPGYPDLSCIGPDIFWVEIKTGRGQLTNEQKECIARITASGHTVHVLRPEDYHTFRKLVDLNAPLARPRESDHMSAREYQEALRSGRLG